MEVSQRSDASHATVSPCGALVAYLTDGRLRVCHAHIPESIRADFNIPTTIKDVTSLKWSSNGASVAIISNQSIEIRAIEGATHPTRIENGSGSLGRFVSADFVGDHDLLTVWEFGRAKVWNLSTAKGTELGDLKTTCDSGSAWRQRPTSTSDTIHPIALLSRTAAEDTLTIHFPGLCKSMPAVKLPTTDAQSLSWSPNGRWLAVLDTPTVSPSVHFYTPDALYFRSYPSISLQDSTGLGIKALTWSADSRMVALSLYDGKIKLLNTLTFAPLATIEHTLRIDQGTLPLHQQAPFWQELVSASNERTYTRATQPVSPPISRIKPSSEPPELGVAEARFSADGGYLATRDGRMMSTLWVWNMATLAAHAVVMQHNNIRRLHWHPTRAACIMIDCGEGIAYLYDVSASSPQMPTSVLLPGTPALSWIHTVSESRMAILVATKSSFRVLYPEGRDSTSLTTDLDTPEPGAETYEEGASEDSLLDVLSGRKAAPSYTERIETETEAVDEEGSERLDDTFRAKRRHIAQEIDPLDDSQIF